MRTFCTLFNIKYLSRGLALHQSLMNHYSDFQLVIFPFDNETYQILKKKNLPHVTLVSLAQFEDPALLKIKATRSPVEYCWTCTPSLVRYVIQELDVPNCTYLDADLYFWDSPEILFAEMGSATTMITPHRYTEKYDQSKLSGIYCVQWVTFSNHPDSLEILEWWRNACIDWCYARVEDNKCGDQKYLDNWPEQFKGVHVLQHLGGGVAPWNIQQYQFKSKDNQLIGVQKTSGTSFPIVFYHFHYLRFLSNGRIRLCTYNMSPDVKKYIYLPYLRQLRMLTLQLETEFGPNDYCGLETVHSTWKTRLQAFRLFLKGESHYISIDQIKSA